MLESKWDNRFLNLATEIASWSKDPSTKVGAVIVDKNNRIISTGYNGFAKGVNDYISRLENRDTKYEFILHAEVNALLFAKQNLEGCRIYTWPFMPCNRCASMIVQAGIHEVISPSTSDDHLKRWGELFEISKTIFKEAGVTLYEV